MKIWNPINGTLKRTLNGHTEYVLARTLLQNGDLASGSADRTMKIWNPINGTLKRIFNGHSEYVFA
jgi:WD40 repeat protein